jgi:hypothetical protein
MLELTYPVELTCTDRHPAYFLYERLEPRRADKDDELIVGFAESFAKGIHYLFIIWACFVDRLERSRMPNWR